MQNRTTKSTVHFDTTISFDGSNLKFPPGDYQLVEDEELIEGLSWLAYRRKATFIQFPAIGKAGSRTQLLEIDHDELTEILNQDLQNGVDHLIRKGK